MKKRSTKKSRDPSEASLREIPEVSLETHRVLGRGRHVALAERSFEALCIDKKVAKTLGGPDAIRRILETLAESIERSRKKKKRRAA
jgi:hypothetical protein